MVVKWHAAVYKKIWWRHLIFFSYVISYISKAHSQVPTHFPKEQKTVLSLEAYLYAQGKNQIAAAAYSQR